MTTRRPSKIDQAIDAAIARHNALKAADATRRLITTALAVAADAQASR